MNAKILGHQIESKANAYGIHSAFSCRGNGLVSLHIPSEFTKNPHTKGYPSCPKTIHPHAWNVEVAAV